MGDVGTSPGARAAVFGAWRRGLWIALATVGLVAVLLLGGRRDRGPRAGVKKSPAVVTVPETVLRREPSASAAGVMALTRGDEVTVVSDRGAWIEVRAGKGSGFVRSGEIERDEEREAREERAKKILSFPPVYGVVADTTPVFLAPFPFAPRAGSLLKGTVIPIHAVDHAYFAYRDRANGIAFVASADVDLVPPDPKTPDIVPDSSIGLRRLSALDSPTPFPTPVLEMPPAAPQAEAIPGERPTSRGPEPPIEQPGESVEPAVVVEKVDPPYPEPAIRAQVEGSVVLDIGIDENGRVTDVQVARGLPFGLSEAAAGAVRQWRYRPARSPEGPIPSRKTVRILFTLRGGE
ncbi:MAG TPA: TonB family protein [Thermoanaerobaculia bacterium]|nr:TonB family protein [Thermoanaerobaculia bacterium]